MTIPSYEELEQTVVFFVFSFLFERCVTFLFMCPFVCLGTHMCPLCVGAQKARRNQISSVEDAADCLFLWLGPELGSPGTLSSALNHWAYLRPGDCLLYF